MSVQYLGRYVKFREKKKTFSTLYRGPSTHRIGGNRKLSTNVDKNSLETEFSIAICRPFLSFLVRVRRLLKLHSL